MSSLIQQINSIIKKAIVSNQNKVINKTMLFKQGTDLTPIDLGKLSY